MRISDWSSDVCSSDLQAENRPCGPTVSTATRRSLRFSACPALSPVCFLGPATAAPTGMERWGRASLPPTRSDPVLVGPGFCVGSATARHFTAPAHAREIGRASGGGRGSQDVYLKVGAE